MVFDDLYQEIILDHYRHPRNAENLDHLPLVQRHENPSCGDSIKLDVHLSEDGRIDHLGFDGHGCAISTASGSMMTELMQGRTADDALDMVDKVIQAMRGERDPKILEQGDLACFRGVMQFPLRVKCATLAWHALKTTLERWR